MEKMLAIVGAGLAGSEAALQLAARGIRVRLFEMRPAHQTPVHTSGLCAELVCSNSFKSSTPESAAGMLKEELRALHSSLFEEACANAVPAGGALAVDRKLFAEGVTRRIEEHELIEIVRSEVTSLEELTHDCDAAILATGPLMSDALSHSLQQFLETKQLSFYDAAAPIVMTDSLDEQVLFRQSRYNKSKGATHVCISGGAIRGAASVSSASASGASVDVASGASSASAAASAGDYLNAPFTKEEYDHFITELVAAKRTIMHDFETHELFQACQPIEELARKGHDAPRFGALKPVGLIDPRTGKRPWAVVQLRAENRAGSAYNLVGFQTNLTFPEQQRVFRLIPGLEQAEFARYGVMHRNTFVNAPRVLDSHLRFTGEAFEKLDVPVFAAGQLAGTEGYCEAIRSGLHCALEVAAYLKGVEAPNVPATCAFGSLLAYATSVDTCDYQPMHVNFGILEPLPNPPRNKTQRYEAYAKRAREALASYVCRLSELELLASE